MIVVNILKSIVHGGWYDSIEVGKHFQAKRLHINPGTKLSVQIHNKRA